jgi:hypothetical protein
VMIMLPFSLDAKKIRFLRSSAAPAATGFVKVKNDNNKNFVIKIRIKNMAEIENLVQSKQTYVVWMLTDNEVTENIGRINSSNKLNVSFETVSSFKPTKIFITAETDESARYPDSLVVLTTDRFWD